MKCLNCGQESGIYKYCGDTCVKKGGGSSQVYDFVIPPIVREQLAVYAHDAWSGWMKYMFGKMEFNNDGTATMPKWAVDRWTSQMQKTYNELSEDMKKSDRQEADRMIAIIKAI